MNSDHLPFTDVLRTTWRLLTFRLKPEEFDAMSGRHLLVGLIFTWMAGVGRYWDAPRGHFLQYAGLGSVIYVIVLAAMLWLVIKPLASPGVGDYRRLLTFLALTSPPAWLYAIPVERFMEREEAASMNLHFLQIVALWRLALLVLYLRRAVRLKVGVCFVAVLLPMSGLVMALALLNLEHVVFELMGGMRDSDRTSADLSYQFVFVLGMMSMPVFKITFCVWVGLVLYSALERRKNSLNKKISGPSVPTSAADKR
jgi:hypothetical protein